MILIHECDMNGIFKSDRNFKSLNDVLIKTKLVDGKETLLDKPVLPKGLTDKPIPKNFKVYPGTSPKFIDGEWVEDAEAIAAHLKTITNDTHNSLEPLDEMTEMILKATSLEELQTELLKKRYGASKR